MFSEQKNDLLLEQTCPAFSQDLRKVRFIFIPMTNLSLCYPSELEAKGMIAGLDTLSLSELSFKVYSEFMTVIQGISLALFSCFFFAC